MSVVLHRPSEQETVELLRPRRRRVAKVWQLQTLDALERARPFYDALAAAVLGGADRSDVVRARLA